MITSTNSGDTTLDVGRRLMTFNWLAAGYAHRDWLGPWSEIIEPRSDASLRLLRRVSMVLLDRYDLRSRYLRDIGPFPWLLQAHSRVVEMADDLGLCMLGGWVQRRLERHEVAQQLRVLGPERRKLAMERARTLRALPHAPTGAGWGVPLTGAAATRRLGLSCLSALLDDPASGARERFTLRFSHGLVVPIALSSAQRDEALAIIHTHPTGELQ